MCSPLLTTPLTSSGDFQAELLACSVLPAAHIDTFLGGRFQRLSRAPLAGAHPCWGPVQSHGGLISELTGGAGGADIPPEEPLPEVDCPAVSFERGAVPAWLGYSTFWEGLGPT